MLILYIAKFHNPAGFDFQKRYIFFYMRNIFFIVCCSLSGFNTFICERLVTEAAKYPLSDGSRARSGELYTRQGWLKDKMFISQASGNVQWWRALICLRLPLQLQQRLRASSRSRRSYLSMVDVRRTAPSRLPDLHWTHINSRLRLKTQNSIQVAHAHDSLSQIDCFSDGMRQVRELMQAG